MSHHFDTKLAREDPSLNLCDFYLFDGPPGKTVMAMTVNPGAGSSTPDALHPEGLYAFRFDLNGDAREEVTFKFKFGQPRHGNGSEHTHIQPFVVRRATGDDALRGDAGERLIEGETGSVATAADLRAYVGIAPDLFAANAGFRGFMTAFYKDQRFDGDAFLHQQNPFAGRNVTAIVLEVPSDLIGKGKINAWATISLFGHAPEVQVSRWGLPMVTHLFLDDPSDQEAKKEQFNASVPSEDVERFATSIADVAETMTTYAGSAENPSEYGKRIAARLCPDTLPYELGTAAAFEVANFNGRALGDDALDVMLTLVANRALVGRAVPDRRRIQTDFPYYGAPYTAEERVGVRPMPRPAKK
jgi:Domain of unknown function (DUF4331)